MRDHTDPSAAGAAGVAPLAGAALAAFPESRNSPFVQGREWPAAGKALISSRYAGRDESYYRLLAIVIATLAFLCINDPRWLEYPEITREPFCDDCYGESLGCLQFKIDLMQRAINRFTAIF